MIINNAALSRSTEMRRRSYPSHSPLFFSFLSLTVYYSVYIFNFIISLLRDILLSLQFSYLLVNLGSVDIGRSPRLGKLFSSDISFSIQFGYFRTVAFVFTDQETFCFYYQQH